MCMSGSTAHIMAEEACFGYLRDVLGGEKNVSAFIGDVLPAKSDVWAFQISGGPTQDQNFQAQKATAWLAHGFFQMQCVDRSHALKMLETILTKFPALKKDHTPGIDPNVRLFEMNTYPEIGWEEVSDGETTVTVCVLTAQFRVVFKRIEAGG